MLVCVNAQTGYLYMMMSIIRQPAVAGTFYPDDAKTLSAQISAFLDAGAPASGAPKAIIVPHAGYAYSGAIAASAYKLLGPLKDRIKRVVLLGPCHRAALRGAALSSAAAFATPLGDVEIDHDMDSALLSLPQVSVFDATHNQEHSLEVQLPFLQTVLGSNFKLIPMVVGDADADEVMEILEILWGGDETLVVISSDLSHYLNYNGAKKVDGETCKAIENLDLDGIGDYQACGRTPLKGLLKMADKKGLKVTTLDLRNSGDTAGPRDRVVGYGAWSFE